MDTGKMMADVKTALKLKQKMLDRKLTAARAKCPRCGKETLQGRLVGNKNHLRAWCSNIQCTFHGMME